MAKMTKKFFREELQRGMRTAYSLLPTILKRYGIATKVSPRKAYYRLYLYSDDQVEGYNRDTTWWIRGFELDRDGKVYIMVYWQGESTDGDEFLRLPSDVYDCAFLPPTQPVNMGSYYYTARQGINIRPNEIYEAIKALKF